MRGKVEFDFAIAFVDLVDLKLAIGINPGELRHKFGLGIAGG